MAGKPSKAELKRAGKHFGAGDKAYKLGDFAAATREFEEAYRLSEDPIVLFNIAQATRKQYGVDQDPQRLVRARDLYRSFLREVPESGSTSSLRKEAEGLLKEVEDLLSAREKQPPPAPPPGEDPLVVARRLAEQQQYDQALVALEAALRAPNNPHESLVEIYRLKGLLAAPRGRAADAEDAFKKLLAMEPPFSFGEGADPMVLRAFAAAKSFWAGKEPPRVVARVPERAGEGRTFSIDAKVPSDPLQMVAGFDTLVRLQGSREWERRKGTSVAGSLVTAPGLEVVVIATDPYGGAVATAGTTAEPLKVAVGAPGVALPGSAPVAPVAVQVAETPKTPPGPPGKPWYKRPWVWGVAGAVVVGAIVGVVVATRGGGGTTTEISDEANCPGGCPTVEIPTK